MTTNQQINVQEIRLLNHNKIAYNAVKAAFKSHDRAAVVHATGSGKSYIIARTAQDFSKVLIIAPNEFVLNETRKICPPRCYFRTYTAINAAKTPETGYNLIVLDEFHRAGAPEWGKAIRELLDANPHAKVLGTSATDIRYLDGMRDMAQELFDGNVVSRITLKSAIDLGILPNPVYVSSLYTLKDVEQKAKKCINKSNNSDEEKTEGLKYLKGIKHSWQMAHGVPNIIKKYFAKDMKRIIVFCPDVAMAHKARPMLQRWFKHAGYNFVNFYDINYANKNLVHEMYEFQQDRPGIQIAISINMLNEGVHVPNVDAIIMLRGTMSRIIIEQQIGRCLTAKNAGRTPVILDLVNNMDGLNNLSDMSLPLEQAPEPSGITRERGEEADPFPFRVIDEASDIRQLMSDIYGQFGGNITRISRTKEECAEIAAKYKTAKEFKRHDRTVYYYIIYHKWYEELCAHLEKHSRPHTKEECAAAAQKYTTYTDLMKHDRSLYSYILRKGWQDEILSHLTRKLKRYTKDEIKQVALRYNKKQDFRKEHPSMYRVADGHGWWEEITAHMKSMKRTKWNKELVTAEAKKYSSRGAFQNGNQSAYWWAVKNGMIAELFPVTLDTRFKKKEWTKEQVIELASQFRCKSAFRDKHYSALMYAIRNGFENELKYNKNK